MPWPRGCAGSAGRRVATSSTSPTSICSTNPSWSRPAFAATSGAKPGPASTTNSTGGCGPGVHSSSSSLPNPPMPCAAAEPNLNPGFPVSPTRMQPIMNVQLTRDCDVVQIPAGQAVRLPQGTSVDITQSLGGSYTIHTQGGLFRVAAQDADALGLANPGPGPAATGTPA